KVMQKLEQSSNEAPKAWIKATVPSFQGMHKKDIPDRQVALVRLLNSIELFQAGKITEASPIRNLRAWLTLLRGEGDAWGHNDGMSSGYYHENLSSIKALMAALNGSSG